jgi:putative nucleotidyltransferase with HDIG domain
MIKHSTSSIKTIDSCTGEWQALLETLPYPVYIVDTDFNIVKMNRPFLHLFGLDRDVKDLKCCQLIHNCDSPPVDCLFSKTLNSGHEVTDNVYIPSLDTTLNITAVPIKINGDIVGITHSILEKSEDLFSDQGNDVLIEIYASTINEMKEREIKGKRVRDAFFNMLEDINDSYQELEDLFLKLVRVMVSALDAKSTWTRGHSERVSMYAEQIAIEMNVDDEELKHIKLAGLLHDIGKIGTYDYLLDKPGKLTKEEFDIVKRHPDQGAHILQDIKQLSSIIPLIKYHHEKLDGEGYPSGLKGPEIPLGARILHVADSFDSMTSDRPYRRAPGIEFALSELEKYRGTQFDERVVSAFLIVLKNSNLINSGISQE